MGSIPIWGSENFQSKDTAHDLSLTHIIIIIIIKFKIKFSLFPNLLYGDSSSYLG